MSEKIGFVTEPEKKIPVICEADVAVIGGGCTGVMAAVRAARLGAKVVIIEKSNRFGGVATNGLVNVWHSLLDSDRKEQIIGGLTDEVEQMLLRDGAAVVENSDNAGIRFNPNRLTLAFDRLVSAENVKIYFHTNYCSVLTCPDDPTRIDCVLVENKDGRGAVRAGFFIDASGDGDLCRDLGLPSYRNRLPQPPSSCSFLQDAPGSPFDIGEVVRAHGDEFGLEDDWGWGGILPGLDSLLFRADNHVFGLDCSKADELTAAEIEGRRRSAAVSDMLKKYVDSRYELANIASAIGVRDTVHYKTGYIVTEEDLLSGKKFAHTVMRGTYRVDVHHIEDNGITFRYLDGREETQYGKETRIVRTDWRAARGLTGEAPKYYCAPWEMLVQDRIGNLIPVGRMINADENAFGALRVMVNLNQLGEAAGAGAVAALDGQTPVWKVDGGTVCRSLGL